MGTPSPIPQSEATLAYRRLLRREITPVEYVEALRREADADIKRIVASRRKAAA